MLLMLAALAASLAGSPCQEPARMIHIPGGEFWMGSNEAERAFAYRISSPAVRRARWFDAELTLQKVAVLDFCIDRFLVTQANYARFVAATDHRAPGISRAEYERQGFLVHDYDREVVRYLWRSGRPPDELRDHPVVLIGAPDAEAYCRWRRSTLRLPTEAEWEKAARGTDRARFPWGQDWDPRRLNSAASQIGGTSPVGRFAGGASGYGVLDAVGNVFQWTTSVLAGGRRVLKGCAWDDEPGLCRPAFRHGRPADSRHILIGARCVDPLQ